MNGSFRGGEEEPTGMSGAQAHALADKIQAEQDRWRINAVRLVRRRTCCVVLTDSRTGREEEVLSDEDWRRLAASGAEG